MRLEKSGAFFMRKIQKNKPPERWRVAGGFAFWAQKKKIGQDAVLLPSIRTQRSFMRRQQSSGQQNDNRQKRHSKQVSSYWRANYWHENLHASSVNTEGISTFEYKLRRLEEALKKRKSGQDSVIQNLVKNDFALLPPSRDSAIFYAPGRQSPDHFIKERINTNRDPVKCHVIGVRIID